MDKKSLEKLELNKVLAAVSEYCSLESGRTAVLSCLPSQDIAEVRYRLTVTEECDKLLFTYGIGKVEFFSDVKEYLERAKKGSVLTCGELLNVAALLRSTHSVYSSIENIEDDGIKLIRNITKNLYFNANLEGDLTDKIISVDTLSDYASDKLFSIRSRIKSLNAKIREKLAEYSSGKDGEFLQDGIVTIRNDRYVIPVKAEHKSHVKGFIHDRSKTGATFFIEPEYILELNNELISLSVDEREEVEAILKNLSKRVGEMCDDLLKDIEVLTEIDKYYAFAEYSYTHKCTLPKVNNCGFIQIIKGRHPLIDSQKVVPVSVELGVNFNFLLLSGANTGGKTVTLKMIGLFCVMAACGLFIPSVKGSSVAVFKNIFCDIGDSQSIEESLSTFSSHMANIVNICEEADRDSLVLIDELGGGTNPDEGQALAKAIIKHLIDVGARGVVTTHFTSLKEFAYSVGGIENASMQFDTNTLKPLYSIKIGFPGASNALAIAKRLGMSEEILSEANCYLSDGARNFENIVQKAEESRVLAEQKLSEISAMELEWRQKLAVINARIEELNKEKERINRSARSESRKIIADRTEQAEEILAQIEEIFHKEDLSQADLIAARTLKNKLQNTAFDEDGDTKKVVDYVEANSKNIKEGIKVFVKPMETVGTVLSFNEKKGEAEVACGSLKMHIKLKDLQIVGVEKEKTSKVKIVKNLPKSQPMLEINVLGLTVAEALYEVDNFIDRAVTDNLEEIKVIHGVGTGKLRSAIAEHLKRHRSVESFRLGKYGEGETGVTFIKLK